jgi:hypothetical protein
MHSRRPWEQLEVRRLVEDARMASQNTVPKATVLPLELGWLDFDQQDFDQRQPGQ